MASSVTAGSMKMCWAIMNPYFLILVFVEGDSLRDIYSKVKDAIFARESESD